MDAPPLRVRGLVCMASSLKVVDDVSFDVQEGEVVGLVGHEGSGISAIVRACLGLIRPASGEVSLFGREVHSSGRQELHRVGSCLKDAAFIEWMGARDNLRYFADLAGVRDDPRIEWALSRTGLSTRAEEPVSTWPGPLRRRLAVARALASGGELLILEEPTAGLDEEASRELSQLLKKLAHEAGVAVLIATKDLSWAIQCVRRLLIVDGGKAVFEGPVSQVSSAGRDVAITVERADKAAEDLVRVRGIGAELTSAETLRLSADVDIADVVAFLVGRRYRVTAVERKGMTLDEFLIRLALGPLPRAEAFVPSEEVVKDPLALLDDGDADLSAFLKLPRAPAQAAPAEPRKGPSWRRPSAGLLNMSAWELRKLAHDPAARFGVGMLVAVGLVALVACAFAQEPAPKAQETLSLSAFYEPKNGWSFAKRLLGPVIGLLGPVALCAVMGRVVAGEAERGLLAEELARCGRRRSLAFSKLISAFAYVAVLVLVVGLVGILLGRSLLGGGPLIPIIAPREIAMGLRFTAPEGASALVKLMAAYAVGILALWPVAAMALLVSSLSARSSMAVAISGSIYFALHALSAIPGLGELRQYLIVRHLRVWEAVLRPEVAWGDFWRDSVALIGTLVLVSAAFVMAFSNRECPSGATST